MSHLQRMYLHMSYICLAVYLQHRKHLEKQCLRYKSGPYLTFSHCGTGHIKLSSRWVKLVLRRDDTFSAKIQENETAVAFLYCHSIDIADRPNKV